jgi:hypothetical protein
VTLDPSQALDRDHVRRGRDYPPTHRNDFPFTRHSKLKHPAGRLLGGDQPQREASVGSCLLFTMGLAAAAQIGSVKPMAWFMPSLIFQTSGNNRRPQVRGNLRKIITGGSQSPHGYAVDDDN